MSSAQQANNTDTLLSMLWKYDDKGQRRELDLAEVERLLKHDDVTVNVNEPVDDEGSISLMQFAAGWDDAALVHAATNELCGMLDVLIDLGANVQTPGLLTAVAMMAAGWDGCPNTPAPGFPADGSWVVKWEGLKKMP